MTVGSFGVSKARPEALTYTYYGHCIATPLPHTQCDGVSIDYIYPAVNGQTALRRARPPSTRRSRCGTSRGCTRCARAFEQSYAVGCHLWAG